jgi:hypothetical protein
MGIRLAYAIDRERGRRAGETAPRLGRRVGAPARRSSEGGDFRLGIEQEESSVNRAEGRLRRAVAEFGAVALRGFY